MQIGSRNRMPIVYQLKLNGNTAAGPVPQRHLVTAMISTRQWLILTEDPPMATVILAVIEKPPYQLAVSNQIFGGFTTCTEMYGNGAWTIAIGEAVC